MQKIYLTIALATAAYCASAQSIFPTDGTNVGIGTPSPSEKLTIRDPNIATNAGSGIVKIRFDSGDGGGGIGFEKETFNTGGLRFYTQYGYGSMLEKMRIAANGNMGIGTTGPGAKLEIAGTGTSLFIDNNQFSANRNPLTGGVVDATRGSSVILLSSSTSGGNLEFFTNSITGGTINERMRITETGNVGIGTTTPAEMLTVMDPNIPSNAGSGVIKLRFDSGNGGGGIGFEKETFNTGGLRFYTQYGYGSVLEKMRITANGNVGIGTASPDTKLTVNGTIHTSEVKVDLTIPAPDYVFEPAYQLTGLSDLKAYIDQHHHLPEMPSADQLAKDGLSLGDMNLKLLKKVEELTLYLLEQQKELEQLKQQLNGVTHTVNNN